MAYEAAGIQHPLWDQGGEKYHIDGYPGTGAAQVQAALDDCYAKGGGFVVGLGAYDLGATGIKIPPGVWLGGFITLTYSGTGVAVELVHPSGGSSITERGGIMQGVEVVRSSQQWDDGTDTTSVGIRSHAGRYHRVYAHVEGFHSGVQLWSSDAGCAHNTIIVERIYDCRYGVHLEDDAAGTGWVTSNKILEGLIAYRSGTIATANANGISIQNIRIQDNNFSHNDNKFRDITVELATSGTPDPYHVDSVPVYCDGQRNEFQLRFEYQGTVEPEYFIRYGNQWSAGGNRVIGGRLPTDFCERIDDQYTAAHFEPNRVIGFGRRGCLLKRDTAQTIPTGANTDVEWESASFDTEGLWSSGDTLTIPNQVRRIRVHVQFEWQSGVAGSREAQLLLNGAVVARDERQDAADQTMTSRIIDVDPGDLLKLRAFQDAGVGVDLQASTPGTYMEVEVIE